MIGEKRNKELDLNKIRANLLRSSSESLSLSAIRKTAQDNNTTPDEDVKSSAPVAQQISSAKTSIRQIPALFINKNVEFGETNIDIGGGRFDLATDYLRENGTTNYVFDPYNRSEEVNAATLRYLLE